MLNLQVALSGRLVLIVGAGSVGARKARLVLDAGARVRIVAREACSEEFRRSEIDWRREEYRPEHLDGVCLVFAAATENVNARVSADALQRGLWVNDASRPERGNVLLPASRKHGRIQVSVSTYGASPILARQLCEELLAKLDPVDPLWADCLAELRPEVLEQVADAINRRAIFHMLADPAWRSQFQQHDAESVTAAMRARIAELRGE